MNDFLSSSERGFEVERTYFTHCRLKRKLDGNGFAHNEKSEQEQELCPVHEKRQRFTTSTDLEANGQLCANLHQANGHNVGTDSLLHTCSNMESTGSSDIYNENTGMEVESEDSRYVATEGCPPISNTCSDYDNTLDCSSSSTNNSPDGSPARDFLRTHKPDCMMHCIPSYCHPGGLWDAMLEVYHGL